MGRQSRESSPSFSYSRMNSEVFEKPSHFEQDSDNEESLDILALLSSPEYSEPPSEEQVCVLEFGGLSPCSSSKGEDSSVGSFEVGFGDELDEGFDEEFELFDNDDLKDTNNIELNDPDLQRVLIDQNTLQLSNPLLEDFDLGVDVFDPSFQVIDEQMNKPHSPYHNHTPSPASVSGQNGMYYPPTTSFNDFEPMGSYTNSNAGASWYNPTLSSVNIPLDLNETMRLMNNNLSDLIPNSYTATPNSPIHTPMSADHSPSPCFNDRMSRSLSPAPSLHAHTPQTNSGAYYTPSPAESAHTGASMFSNISFSPMNTTTMSDDSIVDIPFHKFKKVLDDDTVQEIEKERLKAIRRRGKNKRAAKNCREKKITMISGLQQEVDQMRAAKAMLDSKRRSLQQEITRLKKFCTLKYNSLSSS